MVDPLADNPPELDTPDEVRSFLRDQGVDPMDTDTRQKALFGNALLHGMEDEPPDERGGRTDAMLALEWEMVASELDEDGVTDVEPPVVDDDIPEWLEGP